MKKILSLILCVLMLVPCFAWQISAEYDPEAPLENVAPKGGTYHSSIWNNDRGSKFLNNGSNYNSYQFWEPCASGCNVGPVDDTLQYAGFKFNDYYECESMKIYLKKWGNENGGFCPNCMTQFLTDQLVEKKYEKGNLVSAACPNCTTEEKKQAVTFTYNDHNNIKYTIKALVLGEWLVLGYGYNDDCEYYVKDGSVVGGSMATLEITFYEYQRDAETGDYLLDENGDPIPVLDEQGNKIPLKVNTKNIRIECTEYGRYSKYYIDQGMDPDKSPLWDHWWKTPCLHEVEIMGREGYTPDFDVPEGAMLSSNAALGGFAGATSATIARNPALGNDDNGTTSWKANNVGGFDEFWIDFDTEYTIKNIALNFGGFNEQESGISLTYNLSVKKDGEWVVIAENKTSVTHSNVITKTQNLDKLENFDLNQSGIGGIKITYTASTKDGVDVEPVINEVIANIDQATKPNKCVFLADYMTVAKKASTATGNLACYGQAYCSSSMDYASISDVSYIIDGNTGYDSPSWFAENFTKGTYCGVVLKEAHEITKVVLHFNDAVTAGKPEEHVMQFEIQAKVNGQYIKVGEGTSYDSASKKEVVSVSIDPTVTDDIRIVYLTNGMTFPFLKELEVYSDQYIYGPYLSYGLDTSRTLYGVKLTKEFATRSAVKRSRYLDIMSPIEYFDIVMQYGIDVSLWV